MPILRRLARTPKDDVALKAAVHELAQERPCWGWRRSSIVLRLGDLTPGRSQTDPTSTHPRSFSVD